MRISEINVNLTISSLNKTQRLKTYFSIICCFQEKHAYIEALNNSTMINFRNDVDLLIYCKKKIYIVNKHFTHTINVLPKLFNLKGMPQYNVFAN